MVKIIFIIYQGKVQLHVDQYFDFKAHSFLEGIATAAKDRTDLEKTLGVEELPFVYIIDTPSIISIVNKFEKQCDYRIVTQTIHNNAGGKNVQKRWTIVSYTLHTPLYPDL